jgi:succinate dehydrogenase / fumarate reductase cytochrome b subunit
MGTPDARAARPLSPHLSVYRFLFTMLMSIVHRITGAALYFGTILLVWWLVALASGPEAYATASWFFASWLGRLILFGYTWALLHHMFGGLRHFIWDTGRGFDEVSRLRLSQWSLIASVLLTFGLWVVGYATMGF